MVVQKSELQQLFSIHKVYQKAPREFDQSLNLWY